MLLQDLEGAALKHLEDRGTLSHTLQGASCPLTPVWQTHYMRLRVQNWGKMERPLVDRER